MAKNIRVYELARELGLSNKEALDLCVSLGIGVKSHSSSIEEAQADRVRRKAEREGLVRATQPPEPAFEVRTGGDRGAASEPAVTPTLAPEPPRPEPPRPAPPRPAPLRAERPAAERPAPPAPRPIAPAASLEPAEPISRPAPPAGGEHHVVRSRPASEIAEPRPLPAPPRPAEQPAAAAPGS
ncbi:MAG: translation initiation factor IF-2 N-terminal domain-containing protein, partial [Actinomycetota bacterium]|nr:translation initiation factor IF-2 N-terminal domain-containing protein [Actinomycetota bacterium]